VEFIKNFEFSIKAFELRRVGQKLRIKCTFIDSHVLNLISKDIFRTNYIAQESERKNIPIIFGLKPSKEQTLQAPLP
jgi:hypothetical protein